MIHQVPWIDGFCGLTLTISHHHLGMCAMENHQSFNKTKDIVWRQDLFEESMVAAGLSVTESSTKLYISNLHYGVTKEDIQVAGSLRFALCMLESDSSTHIGNFQAHVLCSQLCFRNFFPRWVI